MVVWFPCIVNSLARTSNDRTAIRKKLAHIVLINKNQKAISIEMYGSYACRGYTLTLQWCHSETVDGHVEADVETCNANPATKHGDLQPMCIYSMKCREYNYIGLWHIYQQKLSERNVAKLCNRFWNLAIFLIMLPTMLKFIQFSAKLLARTRFYIWALKLMRMFTQSNKLSISMQLYNSL